MPKKGNKTKNTKVKEEIKIEVIKPNEKEIDEELEEEYFEDEEALDFSSFNYPFMRRAAPSIRVQPVITNLEIDLDDIPVARNNDEENGDQYKPSPEKNYSLGQKYELPGAGAYEEATPKTIQSRPPGSDGGVSLGQGRETTGYPGQGSEDRKYDSGLERETQQDRRRRM